ncbi:YceI family protein [Nannocystaceae bacterium ST9]
MKIHRIANLLPLLALSFTLANTSACKSEIDDKPKAKVEDAGKKAAEPPKDDKAPVPAVVELTLAKDKSKVGFIGAKITADHPGSFSEFTGTAKVADGKLQSLDIVVDTKSLTADPVDLQNHLKAADFFDVEKFPEAKFSMLEITEKPGEGGATHEIAGNLEMKGVTKKITFPATVTISEAEVHGKASFKIERALWGITYEGMKDDAIKPEVALELDLHFPRA